MEIIGTIKLGLQFRNGIVPLPKYISLWFYFFIANTSLYSKRSNVFETDTFWQELLPQYEKLLILIIILGRRINEHEFSMPVSLNE